MISNKSGVAYYAMKCALAFHAHVGSAIHQMPICSFLPCKYGMCDIWSTLRIHSWLPRLRGIKDYCFLAAWPAWYEKRLFPRCLACVV